MIGFTLSLYCLRCFIDVILFLFDGIIYELQFQENVDFIRRI